MTFTFMGKRYRLNAEKFKSFLIDSISFLIGSAAILYFVFTFMSAVFFGGH